MNGPRLCCNACGKVTNSIKPFCSECDEQFHLNPTDEQLRSSRFLGMESAGREKPVFGRDWKLGRMPVWREGAPGIWDES